LSVEKHLSQISSSLPVSPIHSLIITTGGRHKARADGSCDKKACRRLRIHYLHEFHCNWGPSPREADVDEAHRRTKILFTEYSSNNPNEFASEIRFTIHKTKQLGSDFRIFASLSCFYLGEMEQ
jgi:hypothetical protein